MCCVAFILHGCSLLMAAVAANRVWNVKSAEWIPAAFGASQQHFVKCRPKWAVHGPYNLDLTFLGPPVWFSVARVSIKFPTIHHARRFQDRSGAPFYNARVHRDTFPPLNSARPHRSRFAQPCIANGTSHLERARRAFRFPTSHHIPTLSAQTAPSL